MKQTPEITEKRMATNHEKYGEVLPFNQPEIYENRTVNRILQYPEDDFLPYRDRIEDVFEKQGLKYTKNIRIEKFVFDYYIPASNYLLIMARTSRIHDKGKYYLKDKVSVGRKYGYRVICVFDWDNPDKIVKFVSPVEFQVDADSCQLYKLNETAAKDFINQFDLSGNCRGQNLFLGLVKGGLILQVMSFGKSRFNKHYYIELMRCCTRFKYRVSGRLGRLSSFASEQMGLYSIIAYNDLAKFSGSSLKDIGLIQERDNPPRHIWTKGNEFLPKFANHKYYKKGNQRLISEGWKTVYDCGQSVYTDGVRRNSK